MNLWKKWTAYCAAGELIGIACAGIIAYLVNEWIGEPMHLGDKVVVMVAMLCAGFVEGYILSRFQWKVLVKKFTRIELKDWQFYTILIAMIGWFFGMLPSLFMTGAEVVGAETESGLDFSNPLIFAGLSVGSGLVLGAFFGLFQWIVLRKHAEKAHQWIIANALGWGLGLGWIYVFASIPSEDSTMPFIILVGVLGGLLAGLSVGAITGLFLLRLKVRDTT